MKKITTAEELVQMEGILSELPYEKLLEIWSRMRIWLWPEELGTAPEGFCEMGPDEKLYHIHPWMELIEGMTSRKSRMRYLHIHELGRSEEQFEDWWQSEMYTMLENMENRPQRHGEPGRSASMAEIIISIAAMAISLAVTAMR